MDTGLHALSALASVKPYDKAFINQIAISLLCREELNIGFDMSKPKLRIAMLGPSLDQQGGIATVEKHILKHVPPEIQVHYSFFRVRCSFKQELVAASWKKSSPKDLNAQTLASLGKTSRELFLTETHHDPESGSFLQIQIRPRRHVKRALMRIE